MKKGKIFSFVLMLTLLFSGVALVATGCGEATPEEETTTLQLVYHSAVEATCTADGNVAYYEDEATGKWYADENGEQELTSITVEATGHIWTKTYYVSGFGTSSTAGYYLVCQNDATHYEYVDTENLTEVASAESASDALTNASADDAGTAISVYIVLTNNITADLTISKNYDVTIDLNGYTITNSTSHTIYNYGTLTILDTSSAGTGTVDNVTHEKASVYNEVGATFTLTSGTLTRSKEAGTSSSVNGGNSYYVLLNHGTTTINGGHIYADGSYSSLIENGWKEPSENTSGLNSVMVINAGYIEGGLNTIKNDDYGVLTINGGTIKNRVADSTNENAQALIMNWNICIINGGEFIGNYCMYLIITESTNGCAYENTTTFITGGNASGQITTGEVIRVKSGGSVTGKLNGVDTVETYATIPT